MVNYILADMISKLHIAANSRLKSIKISYTNTCYHVLDVFYKNGLIRNFSVEGGYIRVFLKYYQNKSIFHSIKIVSRPSKRIFWTLNSLALNYSKDSFSGFYILSTTNGIVTNNDCLLGAHSGGEVLLKVFI